MLSICVVTRNAWESLDLCLRSIIESVNDHDSYELIIVDNDSKDKTRELIFSNYPEAKYLFFSPGVGFTKGINAAISASKGELILITTPSTRAVGDAIGKLLCFLRKSPDIGVVGPKVLNLDGTTQYSSKKFPNPKVALIHSLHYFGFKKADNLLQEFFLLGYESEDPIEVESLTMSLLIAKKDVFTEVGLLDEGYFTWASDVDWCHKVENSHWKQYFIPSAKVYHFRSSVSNKQPYQNLNYYYLDLKYLYKKHFESKNNSFFNFLWYFLLRLRFIAQISINLFRGKNKVRFY